MRTLFITTIVSALCAPAIVFASGSQTFTSSGTFTVPSFFGSLSVQVWGAGGGGGDPYDDGQGTTNPGSGGGGGGYSTASYTTSTLTPGSTVTVVVGAGESHVVFAYRATDWGVGGSSSFGSISASGGAGGAPGAATYLGGPTSGGSGGAGNGGTGMAGVTTSGSGGGAGGAGASGGAGGAGGLYGRSDPNGGGGASPGGGGGGADLTGSGGAGAPGKVTITWTDPPTPTCSVTFTTNPIPYGSQTTLHYTSANATSFYINSIGYVGASGSTSVGPLATTDYGGSAGNGIGTTTCPASLTVNAPPAPTAAISSSLGVTVQIGQSSTIHATFAAGSGDSLTHDNIDSPVGTGLGTTTNPDATKDITFTPTTAGTYTFYARAQTQYFISWSTYAQVTVTVPVQPSCSVFFSANPIAQGQSSTVSWTSANATSFSLATIGSVTPNTSDSTSVTPQSSTNYAGTVVGTGGTVTCPATLSVSCTPVITYTCSGSTIVQTATSSQCAVTTNTSYATCTSPTFCSSGSSTCLNPTPIFNPSGSGDSALSGHLQARPKLVPKGSFTKLYWNVGNVSSCTVSGNNQSWSGASSATNGQQTAAINQQATFTMTCTKIDSTTFQESVTVNVVPVFLEN